jgi:hypothetical protein
MRLIELHRVFTATLFARQESKIHGKGTFVITAMTRGHPHIWGCVGLRKTQVVFAKASLAPSKDHEPTKCYTKTYSIAMSAPQPSLAALLWCTGPSAASNSATSTVPSNDPGCPEQLWLWAVTQPKRITRAREHVCSLGRCQRSRLALSGLPLWLDRPLALRSLYQQGYPYYYQPGLPAEGSAAGSLTAGYQQQPLPPAASQAAAGSLALQHADALPSLPPEGEVVGLLSYL